MTEQTQKTERKRAYVTGPGTVGMFTAAEAPSDSFGPFKVKAAAEYVSKFSSMEGYPSVRAAEAEFARIGHLPTL